MKIVNFSIQGVDSKMMQNASAAYSENETAQVELFCMNVDEAEEDPLRYQKLVEKTAEADMVIVRCMSDPNRFKRFEQYEEHLKTAKGFVLIYSGNIDVRFLYRDYFRGGDEDFLLLCSYLNYKGYENDYALIRWLDIKSKGSDRELIEPVKQREDGIYHPRFASDVVFEDYVKSLDPDLPTAGLLIPANLWIYGNTDHIDCLVGELEDQGMNVIPVFFTPTTTKTPGLRGTGAVVKDYFMEDGTSRIDVMLVSSMFSQLFNSRDSEGMRTPDEQNFFKQLTGVPVLQAMSVSGEYSDYERNYDSLSKSELKMHVAWPEVDGQIITVPIGHYGSGLGMKRFLPIHDRIVHIAKTAYNWAVLSRIPVEERKVAILMYQSRPDSGRIGNAAGFDTVESTFEILKTLKCEGYDVQDVPESSRQLIDEILEGVTNDFDWTSSVSLREKAVALIGKDDYEKDFQRLEGFNREAILKNWGPPPGPICSEGEDIVIPGIMKGNIFIGYQPMRGWAEQSQSLYHDPEVVIPHQYLAFYRWLKNGFGADAVIHMGTHGTLEWLPGKSVGLSSKCYPDLVLDSIPNIYPYIIDDPGEGIQAKRRSEAVLIGHLNPTMARAGPYGSLSTIENLLQDYFKNKDNSSFERRKEQVSKIYDEAKVNNLFDDLGITEDPGVDGFEPYLAKLHEYLCEVKDALIRNGLHILGKVPEGGHMDEVIYSLTRLKNGEIPSMRDSLAECMGYDLGSALDDPSGFSSDGELNSSIVDGVDQELQFILEEMRGLDYEESGCMGLLEDRLPVLTESMRICSQYVLQTLVPNIKRTVEELDNLVIGLKGGYVPPGPSGAPTRGNAHILPMGRNYYAIDPDTVPIPSSWEIGKRMAEQMVERYVADKGHYPKEVGVILWATDTMKTNGDDIAYILWLMGVKPVWSRSGGQVNGLAVVPLKDLGRPRIDVTIRITGLFRDTFPNLIDMIDEAFELVSTLDESEEENYLASNLRSEMVRNMALGVSEEEARMRSSARIFGCPPGTYGAGVNHAIESGQWETVKDLADIYITWSSHAYGRNMKGVMMRDSFMQRFGNVDVTVKNMPDREIDLFDVDDVYSYLGGLNAFVREYGKKDSISFMGDNSNPDKVKIRKTDDECRFVFRSKIFNPKYLDGLKEHGYRGVTELAKLTEYMIGWDATSDVLDDWMYEGVAERFLFDEETREWMKRENPHAMMEVMNRLEEAISRGLWEADEETINKLKDLYIDVEDRLEGMG